jgi:hypothetical protein
VSRLAVRLLARSPLILLEVTGQQGDTLDVVQEVPAPRSAIAQVMVFVEGEFSAQRVSGTPNVDGAPYVWKPGMMTLDRPDPDMVINPGKFRLTVTTPFALHYCVRRPDNRKMNYSAWRPTLGAATQLQLGEIMFVARGSVNIGGLQFDDPALLRAVTTQHTVSAATDDVVAMVIHA